MAICTCPLVTNDQLTITSGLEPPPRPINFSKSHREPRTPGSKAKRDSLCVETFPESPQMRHGGPTRAR